MSYFVRCIMAAGVAALAACTESNTTPPLPNQAPTFTSATSASIAENSSAVVYTAAAEDPEGGAVTLSLTGGGDQAAFTFDPATGALAFSTPPDFEAATDANADNAYEVRLTASDLGGGTSTLDLVVTVTDVDETPGGARYVDVVFDAAVATRNIQFGTGVEPSGGVPLFMDVFTPFGDTQTDRPVIILAFGGAFVSGQRTDLEPIASNFAQRGYVTATIDYRLLSGPPADADALTIAGVKGVHDFFAAVRYFREDAMGANAFGVDPDTIIGGGVSAGAVIASTAGTFDPGDAPPSSATVQTFLADNGGAFGNSSANAGTIPSQIQGVFSISGAINDIAFIDANSAPMYAAHEEFDPVVPCGTAPEGAFSTGQVVSGSCDMIPALMAAGIATEFFFVPGATTHVGFSAAESGMIFDNAAAFFAANVVP